MIFSFLCVVKMKMFEFAFLVFDHTFVVSARSQIVSDVERQTEQRTFQQNIQRVFLKICITFAIFDAYPNRRFSDGFVTNVPKQQNFF